MDSGESNLVKEYEVERDKYQSFARTVDNLLVRLLASEGITVHSVGHRCKTVNSLRGKVEKKRSYETLSQITDLAGVRLITHYEDDVHKIAKVIESEFVIDEVNSIDKGKALDPEKFGYLSLHYVASLSGGRAALKEYSAFRGMKVEIQVRSILQHTWAEIEHDTGYKSSIEIPKHIRRRFSRLAGLLELADQEFIGIRDALVAYSDTVAVEVEKPVGAVGGAPAHEVSLDKISLERFIELDPLVAALDSYIVNSLGADSSPDVRVEAKDISRLQLFGISTLGELRASMVENEAFIKRRADDAAVDFKSHDSDGNKISVIKGVSVLYLTQILIAKSGDEQKVRELLSQSGLYITQRLVSYLANFF